jgi:hypothetical protein
MVTPTCFGITLPSLGNVPRDAQLRSSRYNIVDGRVVSSDVVCGDLRSPLIFLLEEVNL